MSDPFAVNVGQGPKQVTISESAAQRLAQLVAAEDDPDLMLRVTVSGGGCSGFQYGFAFDDTSTGDDRVFERDGVKVVIDEVSLGLLDGSVIDYKDELVGAYFTVENPNATASCGCGTSFSV